MSYQKELNKARNVFIKASEEEKYQSKMKEMMDIVEEIETIEIAMEHIDDRLQLSELSLQRDRLTQQVAALSYEIELLATWVVDEDGIRDSAGTRRQKERENAAEVEDDLEWDDFARGEQMEEHALELYPSAESC